MRKETFELKKDSDLTVVRLEQFWKLLFFVLLMSFMVLPTDFVYAENLYGINYQGRIYKSDNTPLVAESVDFYVRLTAPRSGCVLYSEIVNTSMKSGDGSFLVVFGKSKSLDSGDIPFDRLFASNLDFPPSRQCLQGYKKLPGDILNFYVAFNDGTGYQPLEPLKINPMPFSLDTLNVAGVSSENVLRIKDGPAREFTQAEFIELEALIAGTSTKYATSVGNNIDLSEDSIPRLTKSDKVSGNAIVTGTIGGNTALNTSGNLTTTGNLTATNGAFSAVSVNSVVLNDTTNPTPLTVTLKAPTTITTPYILRLPVADGTSGQVLKTDGSGQLSWQTINTNYLDSSWTGSSNLTTLGAVTAGTWNASTISVPYGGTGMSSGTSGGIPYFASGTTMASSTELNKFGLVYGGGAGQAPASTLAASDGQVFVGQTGAAPVPLTLTGDVSVAKTGAVTVNLAGNTTNKLIGSNPGAGSLLMTDTVTGSTVTGLTTGVSSVLVSSAGPLSLPAWAPLSNDTFNQYALLAGRAAGQALKGGVAASESLILDSTSHATKGFVLINPTGGYVGIGTTAPQSKLDVAGSVKVGADAAICSATMSGAIRLNSNTLEYCNGTLWTALAASGSGITSLNSLTANTQSFAIGSSGTAPTFSSATATHTLNIPMASAAGVTAGLLSKTDYDSFNGKLGSATTFGGDISGSYNAITVDKIKNIAVSAIAPTSGQFLVFNGTTQYAPVSMGGDATLSASGSVTIAGSAVTNSKMASMAAGTIKANTTGSAAAPSDVTIASLQGTSASTFAAGNDTRIVNGVQKTGDAMSGMLTLATGTSSLSPLNIPGGTLVTTPVSGNIESNGSNIFWTTNTSARQKLAMYPEGSTPANGQLLIGNGTGFDVANLTAAMIPGLDVAKLTTGILPIARGGTNSGNTLLNNQLMVSNSGAIKELGAMTDGQIIVGKTSNAPQIVNMSGDISITNAGATTVGKINGTAVSGVGLATNNVLQNTGSAISGNSVLVSNGTATGVTALGTPVSGVLLATGSVPTWQTLSADSFTQYALLAGRAGGQTLNGGNAASENLILNSTAHATKGNVLINTTGGNVGIGTTSPQANLDVVGSIRASSSANPSSQYTYLSDKLLYWFNQGSYYTQLSLGSGTITLSGANTSNAGFIANYGYIRTNMVQSGAVGGSAFSTLSLRSSLYGISTSTPAIDLQVYDNSGNAENLSRMQIFNGDNGKIVMLPNGLGSVGIGATSPSGKLHIAAGTASAGSAPLKLTAGTNLTIPEAGAIEFDGTSLFYTDSTNTRRTLGVAGSGLTALTGDVSASGSGSVAATVNSVGGSTAANVHSAELLANAATNANTANTIVKRDTSGNFSAGMISGNLTGTVTGSASLNVLKAGDTMTGNLTFGANLGTVFTGSSGTATLQGPSGAIATNYVLRLPTAQGSANQTLANDGSGNLSWQAHIASITANSPLSASTVGAATTLSLGTVPIANGGTGATTQQAAINALAGAVTSGQFLRGNGTNVVMSALQSSDLPSGTLAGSGTAGYVPYYSASTTLANSPLTVSGSNVGVGVTSSGAKLEVAGTIQSDTGGFLLTTQGRAWPKIGLYPTDLNNWGRGDLVFAINNAQDSTSVSASNEVMRLTAGGNLLIGTSSSASILAITGTRNGSNLDIAGVNIAPTLKTTALPGLTQTGVSITPSFVNYQGVAVGRSLYIKGAADSTAITNTYALYVDTPTGGANNYAAVFNGGNVGIGTTSPGNNLHVINSQSFNPTANVNSAIMVGQNSYGGGILMKDTTNYVGMWSVDGGQTLAFGSGGTASGFGNVYGSMSLKNGNLGIGSGAPTQKLDVAGNIRSTGQAVSSQATVASGGTIDFNSGNVQVLMSVGSSALTLNNMIDGGAYTIVLADTTSRTYSFGNCTVPHFNPANTATTAGTMSIYNVLKLTISSQTHCIINWQTGL